METKVCSECGEELPIKYFHTWKRKDGTTGVLHQCLHCQRQKANRRYSDKKKFGEIASFEDRIVIEELKRRNINVLGLYSSEELMDEICSRERAMDF